MMDPAVYLFAALLILEGAIFSYIYRARLTKSSQSGNPKSEQNSDQFLRELVRIQQSLSRIDDAMNKASRKAEQKRLSVTESELDVLRLLVQQPRTAKELSEHLNKNREYISRTLKDLYEKGLVTRQGRPYTYSGSEEGRRIIWGRRASSGPSR